MSESAVLLRREGAVAILTLNRPLVGNAIQLPLTADLEAAATMVAVDPTVRCVVLTGAGKLFCGGGDIAAMSAAAEISVYLKELAGSLHRSVMTFTTMSKPLVVLVNGPAAGAGLSLAMLGDVVLAARSAHFSAAYGSVGLTPDGGMSWLLPRLVGLRRAQELILTNRRISADAAEAIGLVTRVVEDACLEVEGMAVALALASGPTPSMGLARGLLRDALGATLEDHLAREAQTIAAAAATADFREGMTAFLERRAPNFLESSNETAS